MQQFFATVAWRRDGQDFAHERCYIADSLTADVVIKEAT